MTIRIDQNAVADIGNARTMGLDALTIPTNRVSFSFHANGRSPPMDSAGAAVSSVTSQESAHTGGVHKMETFPESGADMLQQSLPRWVNLDRFEAAEAVLEKGNVTVCKVSRSGFTKSAIIAAHKRGLKTLIVSPTKKLLEYTVRRTVEDIGGVYCSIPGNQSCKYVKEKIKADHFLRKFSFPRGKCSGCDSYDMCPVTEIERVSNPTVIGMTYAKLEAILMSKKEMERIGDKLSDIDLVILEEAHTISYPPLPEVDFNVVINWPDGLDEHLLGRASKDYDKSTLRSVYDKFCSLRSKYEKFADAIRAAAEADPQRYTGFPMDIPYPTEQKKYHFQLRQLRDVAEIRHKWWPNEKQAKINLLTLKDIVSIMSSKKAVMSYQEEGDAGKMIITSGQGNIERAIRSFLRDAVPEAKACFVSSTLAESLPGFFSLIALRELTSVIFPDLHNTNAKMHIHPSTWRFSAMDANGIERAVKEILEIYEAVDHQPIYLLAMNESLKNQLKERLKNCGNIRMDYYRSRNTMGIEAPENIAIAVGLAQTPRHSCDPLAAGIYEPYRYDYSQRLRLNEVHAATWQAWSRIKDPNGKVESHVYCVGVRADEISDVVTWGINRRVTASCDGKGKFVWNVEVDKELDRPIVHTEKRTSRGLDRHSIKEYIDRVVPVQALIDWRRNSGKSTQFPYILGSVYRENVDFLWNSVSLFLHNHPFDEEEMEATSFGMAVLFTGRRDCYACQSKNPGKNGEKSFRKSETSNDVTSLIKSHLNGSETIGFYPFDAEDQCYYCAIEVQQRERAMKLSQFLQDNSLPMLVEELATRDAYHIWIPMIPTKTRTVHKFAKQLLHDAEIEGALVYPRQKSINSCHKSCGDFLALPLGMDQENARLSEFIDPITFAPVESVVIKDVLRFREAPESKATMQSPEDESDPEATDDSDAC